MLKIFFDKIKTNFNVIHKNKEFKFLLSLVSLAFVNAPFLLWNSFFFLSSRVQQKISSILHVKSEVGDGKVIGYY